MSSVHTENYSGMPQVEHTLIDASWPDKKYDMLEPHGEENEKSWLKLGPAGRYRIMLKSPPQCSQGVCRGILVLSSLAFSAATSSFSHSFKNEPILTQILQILLDRLLNKPNREILFMFLPSLGLITFIYKIR